MMLLPPQNEGTRRIIKILNRQSVMAHTSNPITQEATKKDCCELKANLGYMKRSSLKTTSNQANEHSKHRLDVGCLNKAISLPEYELVQGRNTTIKHVLMQHEGPLDLVTCHEEKDTWPQLSVLELKALESQVDSAYRSFLWCLPSWGHCCGLER